jgi:hypothetical protein
MARAGRTDFPDKESEIFLANGLDRANQLEAVTENRRPEKPFKAAGKPIASQSPASGVG